MTLSFTHALAVGLLALAPSTAQAVDLQVWIETDPAGYRFNAQMTEAPGPGFALVASVGGTAFSAADAEILGVAMFGPDGYGCLEFTFEEDFLPLPESSWVHFAALTREYGVVSMSDPAEYVLGQTLACEELDFNFTIGQDDVMVAGRVIDEQWAEVGMHISADAKTPGLPDQAILFDSDNPTGGDFDLGAGLGQVLIIDEDGFDGDNDGLIDDPDDAMFGGTMLFTFDEPATICSATLIDIDELPGSELRFYRDGDGTVSIIPITSLGDGEVQKFEFLERGVDRMEVFLRGSGAIAGIDMILCPRFIDFDESTLGKPLGFLAGQWITDEFLATLGVQISAENDGPASGSLHPDKAILFDTSNPTGGDDDLLTPNPANPTNDEPLGFVFIIAEDDFDGNNDGLVDDPDDEQFGGRISFDFSESVTFVSAKVLDCDDVEVDVFRFFDQNDNEIYSAVIPNAPDGSVQLLEANISGVYRAVLELGGSGAVARVKFCPDGGGSVLPTND